MNSTQAASASDWFSRFEQECPAVAAVFKEVLTREPLRPCAASLAQAYHAIAESLAAGGILFLCGNGGSMADALHISGELLKSFRLPRPLPQDMAQRLRAETEGDALVDYLQAGLRAYVLGNNPALVSAAANDQQLPGIPAAQELLAMAKPGDVLLGISTSGRARNVHQAVSVARALQMTTIGLTGQAPNPLCDRVDICLAVPERETYKVQELHQALYHQLCLMLESRFF